jgi:hypothetical protein
LKSTQGIGKQRRAAKIRHEQEMRRREVPAVRIFYESVQAEGILRLDVIEIMDLSRIDEVSANFDEEYEALIEVNVMKKELRIIENHCR